MQTISATLRYIRDLSILLIAIRKEPGHDRCAAIGMNDTRITIRIILYEWQRKCDLCMRSYFILSRLAWTACSQSCSSVTGNVLET